MYFSIRRILDMLRELNQKLQVIDSVLNRQYVVVDDRVLITLLDNEVYLHQMTGEWYKSKGST